MDKLTFELGEYEEGLAWKIEFNRECSLYDRIKPCKHASEVRRDEKYAIEYVTVPRLIVAYNEGGYLRTMVCLDCILEAAAKIEGE